MTSDFIVIEDIDELSDSTGLIILVLSDISSSSSSMIVLSELLVIRFDDGLFERDFAGLTDLDLVVLGTVNLFVGAGCGGFELFCF